MSSGCMIRSCMHVSRTASSFFLRDSSVPGELLLRKTDGTPPIHLGKGDGMGLSEDGTWALAISAGSPRDLILIPTGPGTVKRIPIEGVEPQQALLLPSGKGFLVLGRREDE